MSALYRYRFSGTSVSNTTGQPKYGSASDKIVIIVVKGSMTAALDEAVKAAGKPLDGGDEYRMKLVSVIDCRVYGFESPDSR